MSNNKSEVVTKEVSAEEFKQLVEQAQANRTEEFKLFVKTLQRSLFYFTQEDPFIGGLLQELNFKAEYRLPTAALVFNKEKRTFEILINPTFFLKFNEDERIGILHHEIMHFTHNHMFRLQFKEGSTNQEDNKVKNIAADMSINQLIKTLPEGCVDFKKWRLKTGQAFPPLKTSEEYYDLLSDQENQKQNEDEKGDGNNPNSKTSNELGKLKGGDGTTLDEHGWGELSEEEKKAMAEEMKSIVKRTMEKTNYDRSQLPGSIKEFLEEIETFLKKLNYKRILQDAIKKFASSTDRDGTWKRPNKRVGQYAPGSTLAKLPRLNIYVDTSGSISVTELNIFLRIIDGFLKVGSRTCTLALWHTTLYSKKKYKLRQQLDKSDIESGGTDLNEVIDDINKTSPDLSIILTDGYYGNAKVPKGQTFFIISEGGNMEHHLKDKCKTINISGLKDK